MINIKKYILIGLFFSFGGTCSYNRSWHLSESQILTMLGGGAENIHVAFFSPRQGREIKELLVGLIAHEQKSLACAVFYLTNKHVIYALQDASERGVPVQLVISQESTKNGLVWQMPSVRVCFVADGLMHHKFIIFKDTVLHKSLLWTGSFNFTNQAVKHNRENIIVLDDERLMQLFADEFESLQKSSYILFSQQAFNKLPQLARNFEACKKYINREQLQAAIQKSLAQEQFVIAQPIEAFLQERDTAWWNTSYVWWCTVTDWAQSKVEIMLG